MKWVFLAFVTAAGLNAIAPNDIAFEAPECAGDQVCIERYSRAFQNAVGDRVARPTLRFLPWTPRCPDVVTTTAQPDFRPCYHERP